MPRLRLLAVLALAAFATSACTMGGVSVSGKPSAALQGKKPDTKTADASGAPLPAGPRPGDASSKTAAVEITSGDDLTASLVTASAMGYAPAAASLPPMPLITKYASAYGIPESLVHKVVKKESNYNPAARNGPYYGLMQIRHSTAAAMGYKGSATGLLDADTNLRYAVKYLAGAYKVAKGDPVRAMKFYQSGYYYDAKRLGLLDEVGLR